MWKSALSCPHSLILPAANRLLEAVLDVVECSEVVVDEMRRGLRQHPWLQDDPEIEHVVDFVERQFRDDGALLRDDLHQPFGLKLKQGFPHRDAADAIGLAQGVLAQLRAGRMGAVEDRLPELIGDHGRQGAVLQRRAH